jgi:hypothetical protein
MIGAFEWLWNAFLWGVIGAGGTWAVLRLMRHAAMGKWVLPDENVRYQPRDPEDFDG